MATYVAFLRTVNLGRAHEFPMDDLRRVVTESTEATDVQTYSTTGNLRFTTAVRSPEHVRAVLEAAFLADRGFEVPTVVFSRTEFAAVVQLVGVLAQAHPGALRHHVDLLQGKLPADVAGLIEAGSSASATFVVQARAVHSVVHFGSPALVSQEFCRLLGVTTNRTANVLLAMGQQSRPSRYRGR